MQQRHSCNMKLQRQYDEDTLYRSSRPVFDFEPSCLDIFTGVMRRREKPQADEKHRRKCDHTGSAANATSICRASH